MDSFSAQESDNVITWLEVIEATGHLCLSPAAWFRPIYLGAISQLGSEKTESIFDARGFLYTTNKQHNYKNYKIM